MGRGEGSIFMAMAPAKNDDILHDGAMTMCL